eukprot:gnl/Spiro4/23_TR13_c0_g1_i1.p1 gnl/Spiro4/23_TR13_c0_g1~~gnl/Spiro4/23_TR13_c0_g1_i1.p1  ORF type:complete len:374 (+),score=101.73 gnl/Spiro4/23_TR13_c0_g1_i1:38-1123(+)
MFLPAFVSIQNALLLGWWTLLYFLWSLLECSIMYFLVFGFGGIVVMREIADQLIRRKELYEAPYAPSIRPAVLITGAARGMGRMMALALSENYHVFAGVRKAADVESWKNPNITGLVMDVASKDSVTAAIRELTAQLASASPSPMHLVAVINNAGVLVTNPLEAATAEQFEQVLQVNLMGVYRVSTACLPLLRAAVDAIKTSGGRGPSPRIVTVSSVAGVLAVPFSPGYSASKCGAQAIMDSLRMELGMTKQGIDVVVVQPGPMKTDLLDQMNEVPELLAKLNAGPLAMYANSMKGFGDNAAKYSNAAALDPSAAGDLIRFILRVRAADLRTYYVLAKGGFIFPLLQALLPTRLLDYMSKA